MSRRGIGILELMVAGVLLGALMTFCLEFFGAVATQRRALEQRQTATEEAANVMERVAARPWESLTTEGLKEVSLCDEAKARLPEATLAIDVAAAGDEPAAKRITVSLQWKNAAGEVVRPVRLVAWRYESQGGRRRAEGGDRKLQIASDSSSDPLHPLQLSRPFSLTPDP